MRGAAGGSLVRACGRGVSALPRRRPALLAILLLAALVTSGHIGDSNTHFRGEAGPYTVRVTVRHPGVVPGLADIAVRVEGGVVRRVTVQPVPSRQGFQGAPRPDEALPVPGQPGLFAAELWFMESGSYSVHVAVAGDDGEGAVVVPVASTATRRLELGAGLGLVLVALGIFLAGGLVTIVRAAVGEAVLAPGEVPDARRIRRARIAAGASVALLVLLLTGGRAWWGAEDAAYRARMFRPLEIRTAVTYEPAATLRIVLGDRRRGENRWGAIVPDHGKIMHAFLVRVPDAAAFAHLHPTATDADSFHVRLPALPAGTYALYADVVHESGFAQTLTASVEIGAGRPGAAAPLDADDAWWAGVPAATLSEAGTAQVRFGDGTTLVKQAPSERIAAGEDVILRFAAREPDGTPTTLAPYMGMSAHAAVRRDDGGVFVHLHPVGSISTAAQQQLVARLGLADVAHSAHTPADDPGTVEIPYAFPTAGTYRIFVQTNRSGTVRTAAFDVIVGS